MAFLCESELVQQFPRPWDVSLFTFVKGLAHPLCHAKNSASRDCNCSSTVSNYMEVLYQEIFHCLKEKLSVNLKLIIYLSSFQNTHNKENSKY